MARSLITSSSAARRLELAREWLAARPPDGETLLVGGSLDGVQDLARGVAFEGGGTFGWQRLSLHRLALRLAERSLLERSLTPASALALEALWARVVHELARENRLGRFAPVAAQPGLPRALARTVDELRTAGLDPAALDPDLARAAAAFEAALAEAKLADRALILSAAAQQLKASEHPLRGLPTLLLDVPLRSMLEGELVQALAAQCPELLATVPAGDDRSAQLLETALQTKATRSEPPQTSGLARLQQNLFGAEQLSPQPPAEDVELLSAPGEMRECVELARAIHREAARGVPFDQMAVLLRAPGAYRSAICEALRRAGVPAHYVRGVRQPDPAGRALLALLACADENLSAHHFAEYLSLGEVPRATPEGTPPPAPAPSARWAPPDPDEAEAARDPDADGQPEPEPPPEDIESEQLPVVAGTLRAPRRWEQLIVEAAVIGGKDRWARRLQGLAERYRLELSAPDLSEGHTARLTKALSDLEAFTAYALPLLELLAALPARAHWRDWLDKVAELATRGLRYPDRVLSVLGELAPLGVVGPVALAEVRTVLSERLLQLTVRPKERRYGRVFVGPVDAARGMSFEVVLIPGLAERLFPQKVREDPIAPDAARSQLGGLETDAQRVASERLQLQLAVGAARTRVVLSYPRIDSADGRPRVPSFYGLEALRAVEGKLPRYEELRRRAERAVDARIGWPAPKNASSAIDVAERDLSVLDGLFRGPVAPPRGGARYLTQVNPFLARALRTRYARWHGNWTQADGLVKPSPEALAALAAHQLSARAFSATALQHFAACPYRFYLSAILKLSPREEPVALEELDPLQKGSMVHEVHYGVLSALRDQGKLPLDPEALEEALDELERTLREVAKKHEDLYAPAIDRVWKDGLVAISADARAWLRQTAAAASQWAPWKFELAFGLGLRDQQDPESRPAPVELDGGLRLRGSIDLVERGAGGGLRATDYKTGKARAEEGTVLGGGKTLQPVLYALALEKLFPGVAIHGGRLYYCTQAGEFSEVFIPLDASTRDAAQQAMKIVGQALEKGFLPAAPAKDECTWCDYRAICGAHEQRRVAVKPKQALEPLQRLREMK